MQFDEQGTQGLHACFLPLVTPVFLEPISRKDDKHEIESNTRANEVPTDDSLTFYCLFADPA